MKLKIVCLVVLCFAIIGSTEARKKNKKKPKTCFQLVEAYSQRTIPGVRRATIPPAAIHFIIVWEGPLYPDAFFWRADTGLIPCNIVKAHKVVNKSTMFQPGRDYYAELVKKEAIQKGDTLDIIPMQVGRPKSADSIPVTDGIKNTLFFKRGSGNWESFHVDTIARKRDIVMP